MGKNGYLERRQKTIDIYRQAEKETTTQYMIDIMIVTLNDPDVMGKDTFGAKRINRFLDGLSKTYGEYYDAISNSHEADYYQEKLDERLKKILGEKDFQSFEERYEWLKKQKY